ncbi:MAG: FAD/NAD(P)-binding protein [Candidatus Hodarchaeales archaeon]|jgi:NAD(P)H-flavin reductase
MLVAEKKKVRKNPYIPFDATITRISKMNEESVSIQLDSRELREMYYEPGQFVEVTVYGVGECVIGVTDSMYDLGFELAVRNTGGLVTSKLVNMNQGDIIGIRGPFGKPFPMDDFKGKNMLFICAGIGFWPVRSTIKYVMANRADYGKLIAIFGVRKPSLFTFISDIEMWMDKEDMKIQRTVDSAEGLRPEDKWDENIGLITTLTDKLEVENPDDWIVVCVGPPIAFKFIRNSLKNRGFNDDQIWVSLERKMKCGFGKCNHCLIDGTNYVCMDGPVFRLRDVKKMSGGLD